MPEMNESPSGLTQYPLLPLRDVVEIGRAHV